MARGYSGAFGHKLNAPYVFLPLCAIFLLGLVDWRRLWRVANLDLLVLLGFGVSHFFFNRAEIGVSVPLAVPGPALPPGPGAVDRVPRPGRGAAAGLAGGLAAGRGALPDGLPGRPQRRRLGRDRRRLRQRRRRRPHHPRRTDLRQLPRRRLPGRHLRPGQLLRLRPLRADLALVGKLGRPARRPRRRGRLRPRSPSASCSCSASASAPDRPAAASPRSSPSAGPPTPTPPSPSSRTPTTPWSRCSSSRPCSSLARPDRPRRAGVPRDLRQVRPGAAGPDAASPTRSRTAARSLALRRPRFAAGRAVAGDAVAGDRPRPAHLLRPHDRLPGRPRLALQHLGPGPVAGAAAHRDPRRDRGALPLPRLPAPRASPWSRSRPSARPC